MSNGSYVVDTHALLWFLTKDRRLSKRASAVLLRGADAQARVFVSVISLAEAVRLIEKGKVRLRGQLLDVIERIEGFEIVSFDLDTFQAMQRLPTQIELHDRMIGATADQYGAPLITRDPAFQGVVRTLW